MIDATFLCWSGTSLYTFIQTGTDIKRFREWRLRGNVQVSGKTRKTWCQQYVDIDLHIPGRQVG